MKRLANQVALVTGGASGIGKAIAQRLADEGAHVVIGDVQSELGTRTAEQCGFTFLEQDVCNESGWNSLLREIQSRFGRFDILVNNAGIVGSTVAASPENTKLSDWRQVFAVNTEGVFLGCRAAIPVMRETGAGSIVNISSIAGLLATPYATAYGASKAAVRQLTKSVAQYCAEQRLNIRCNSVHPGIVRTSLWDNHAQNSAHIRGVSVEDVVAEATDLIPAGDFTLAADVAAAVAFLASQDARHMTGAQLIVDGGVIGCDTYEGHASRQAKERHD